MTADATTIRPARPGDARGIACVEVETWRDAYPTLLPRAYLVGRLDHGRAAAKWAGRIRAGGGHVLVAEARTAPPGRHIVGYATWGRRRARGWPRAGEIYELYVSPAARERGVGRRLTRAAAGRMITTGLASMVVEVLDGNPARFFYEALGGRLAARGHHRFWGKRLASVVYAWDDLAAFVAALGADAP